MDRLIKRFIRAGAFVAKEVNEVRRQPRLILSLILGPFLILLLFGVGYKGQSSKLSAIITVPSTGDYSRSPEEYQKLIGDQLQVVGVTTDIGAAIDRMKHREADIVVLVPQDISKTISSGSQVKLFVYFNEVDPLRRDAITYLTYLYANEINKQTVAAAASQGQANVGDVRSAIVRMKNAVATIEVNMAKGEVQEANRQLRDLQGSSTNTQLAIALVSQFMATDTAILKPAQAQDPNQVNLETGQQTASRVSYDIQALSDEVNKQRPDQAAVRTRVSQVRADLDELDRLTQQFQAINPLVLAAPFFPMPEN